jgi:hypothetical protein
VNEDGMTHLPEVGGISLNEYESHHPMIMLNISYFPNIRIGKAMPSKPEADIFPRFEINLTIDSKSNKR